jgi:hypothetical protein
MGTFSGFARIILAKGLFSGIFGMKHSQNYDFLFFPCGELVKAVLEVKPSHRNSVEVESNACSLVYIKYKIY